MAKYLISFPSAAMVVPEGEWEAVGRDAASARPNLTEGRETHGSLT